MQKIAQFDDKIRNLIALAQDGSKHSRTLLFSHISDFFLQGRPMSSPVQERMLTEILKELLDQVALSTRQEITSTLCTLQSPPSPLIDIMCEDVVEVSGPLLERANLPDETLIHVIRYGTETHRIHVSRRFGLSPLVRRELEIACRDAQNSKVKYSLSELDKQAEDHIPDIDFETTENILELLRSQNIHGQNIYDQKAAEQPSDDIKQKPNDLKSHDVNISSGPPTTSFDNRAPMHEPPTTSFGDLAPMHEPPTTSFGDRASMHEPPTTSFGDRASMHEPPTTSFDNRASMHEPPTASFGDRASMHEPRPASEHPPFTVTNDAVVTQRTGLSKNSHIQMNNASSDMGNDILQQAKNVRHNMQRHREFVRTVADWFWEVDRVGRITFISQEAFTVFGRMAQDLMGEDFINLCTVPGDDTNRQLDHKQSPETITQAETFEALFEHRKSFRNKPFYISAKGTEKILWNMSGLAIFDIHSGRFTGFRGSATAPIREDDNFPIAASQTPKPDNKNLTHLQEDSLEDYIKAKALKAASTATAPNFGQQKAAPEDSPISKACNEEYSAELLQNISHEFRTPLNAIIGFSEMIEMEAWGTVNPDYHKNVKNILSAARHLKEAVNDVLDSAKIEAGLMPINPESFSLKSILKDCQKNVEYMAEKKNVRLIENSKNIDVILYNDRQSIELCLTKILESTIKRAHGGEIMTPAVLINSNAQVRIEIPILGDRIDEKDKEKIFQKLTSQADEPNNTHQNDIKYQPKISSGFGLSIAQNLAQIIGANISVHAQQGKLTHFVLTLSNYEPKS